MKEYDLPILKLAIIYYPSLHQNLIHENTYYLNNPQVDNIYIGVTLMVNHKLLSLLLNHLSSVSISKYLRLFYAFVNKYILMNVYGQCPYLLSCY